MQLFACLLRKCESIKISDSGIQIAASCISDLSLQGHFMQRRVLLVLMMVLLVTGSATGVHASTDCQRWFDAYKQQLAHSQAVKRLHAAKLRARRYADMKLAGYVKPKPVPKPNHHYSRRPRMTRAEALRRLNLACGILPEDGADQAMLKKEISVDFSSHRPLEFPPVSDSEDQQMLASNLPSSPFLFPGADREKTMVDMPPTSTPPMWGNPGIPGHVVSSPDGPALPSPVVVAVPEPASVLLLLIGLVGGAGMIRREIGATEA
jgi:hypothetical protein